MPLFRNHPELLLPFREGKRLALEQTYRFYVRGVDRYLCTLARATGAYDLAQPSAVADLLQEVFMKAFSASARQAYDGLREYRPYLNTIARNCFVDALRARGREVLKAPEDLPLEADEVIQPSDNLGDPKVMAVLRDYLQSLPGSLKGVYEQRFVLGNSQQAACEALGLTRRKLRTGEERLRRGLRKALSTRGVLESRKPHFVAAAPAEPAADPG